MIAVIIDGHHRGYVEEIRRVPKTWVRAMQRYARQWPASADSVRALIRAAVIP